MVDQPPPNIPPAIHAAAEINNSLADGLYTVTEEQKLQEQQQRDFDAQLANRTQTQQPR
jgi:hypothetical protein